MGFGKSQGGSQQGDSRSQSITEQNIWGGQAGPLSNLFQNAQGTFNNIQGPAANRSQAISNTLFPLAQNVAGRLSNPGLDLAGNLFQGNLLQQGRMNNPYLNQQVAGLQRDMQTGLEQSLGNIGQGFVSAGQYGGSRQGLAEGQAIRGALDTYGEQVANLRAGDLDRQLQANTAGFQGALQNQANQIAGRTNALAGMQNVMNLGMAPYSTQLNMLGQMADIYGAPTALTQSTSQSESTTRGRGGDSFSFSLI